MPPEDDAEADQELTDEDGEESEPRPQKRYITRVGAQRLHQELLRLLHQDRPKITAEVSAAAAQGDRSENAEYIYGKKKLREIDRRIRFLKSRLDHSTVVDPAEQTDDSKVYFGATVVLEDEEGQRTTYQVVGPDEIDTRGGRISVDSPIGRALLGKRRRETVVVNRPRGELELTIVDIRFL